MRVVTSFAVFVAFAGLVIGDTHGDFQSLSSDVNDLGHISITAETAHAAISNSKTSTNEEAPACEGMLQLDQTAACWLNLGLRLQTNGKLIESKRSLTQAVTILTQTLADSDPQLAAGRNDLAVSDRLLGLLKEAANLNAQALATLRAHPTADLPAVINNRGQILAHEGKWKQARDLYQEAIGLWERQLSPGDPRVAMGLTNLAALMQARKDYNEAEKLLTRAIAIDRAAYPADSPRVALDMNSVGVLAASRKHYAEAEQDFRKSLVILERTRPAGHPDLGEVSANLAEVLRREGRLEESETLFRRSLEILSRAWGPESPRLLNWLDGYVAVLSARQDFAEAEKIQVQATRIRVVQTKRG